MEPIVSVLMTAYNREKYIAEAIESVLASSYENFELVIVDDGSKDKTVAIAKAYANKDARIKLFINEKNLGDYPNRNQAAFHALGKYLKYLDSDDIIYPWGLEVMVSSMLKFPEAAFGLSSKSSDDRPFPICIGPKEIYIENFSGYNHFDRAPGSSIIKKETFDLLGGFSGKQYVGDQEFWYMISRYYKMVKFPTELYWNRLHEDQQGKSEQLVKNKVNKIRRGLVDDALAHPDLPLDDLELRTIKQKLKSDSRKIFIRKFYNYII